MVAKNEHPTAKRVLLEHVLTDPGQTVDPLPEIRRFDRDQSAFGGCGVSWIMF